MSKYQLTEQLNGRVDVCLKEKRHSYINTIRAGLDHYIEEYKRALKYEEPQNVACGFYGLVDEKLKEQSVSDFASCKKSCNFCCRIAVNISKEEAYLLRNEFKDIVNEKQSQLAIQKSCKTAEDWNKLSYKDKACIFLGDDGACRVYQYRPISCRKYHVASPAERCDNEINPEGIVAGLVHDEVEIIASAIINVSEVKLLPEMILKAELEK